MKFLGDCKINSLFVDDVVLIIAGSPSMLLNLLDALNGWSIDNGKTISHDKLRSCILVKNVCQSMSRQPLLFSHYNIIVQFITLIL